MEQAGYPCLYSIITIIHSPRFLCRIKEEEILEPLVPSILANLEHRHSYVRRNAVLAINSIYKLPKVGSAQRRASCARFTCSHGVGQGELKANAAAMHAAAARSGLFP